MITLDWLPDVLSWLGTVTPIVLWSAPKIPQPSPPPEFPKFDFPPISFEMPEMPAPYDPEAADAKRRSAEEIRKIKAIEGRRKGYRSTLLTGGKGVEDDEVQTNKPMLLGRK